MRFTYALRAAAIIVLGIQSVGEAAETPETILIRQTLNADLAGHRRGDLDLVLSAYDENVATYDARNSKDPRAWHIRHEGRSALANSVEQDLQAHRYETERTVPSIQVRGNVATATTIDSGQVVNRQSGASERYYEERLWTLLKREDRWLVTGFVASLGQDKSPAQSVVNDEISAVLAREEEAREAGDRDGLLALFTEHFSGYDGKESLEPTAWKIIFSGSEEFEKHLLRRLSHVTYQVEREVLSAHIGPDQREALAITHDTVKTRHARGETEHRLERYVMWTLSKRDGDWKITNMLYNLGQAE